MKLRIMALATAIGAAMLVVSPLSKVVSAQWVQGQPFQMPQGMGKVVGKVTVQEGEEIIVETDDGTLYRVVLKPTPDGTKMYPASQCIIGRKTN